jgi:hypothetical protein
VAGDVVAAGVALLGVLAALGEVLLDPQAAVSSPAASATITTFQPGLVNDLCLISPALPSEGRGASPPVG